jgi:hypothetical protein
MKKMFVLFVSMVVHLFSVIIGEFVMSFSLLKFSKTLFYSCDFWAIIVYLFMFLLI